MSKQKTILNFDELKQCDGSTVIDFDLNSSLID